MRFQVPQFIDIEDKIFGPMTFKQFMYVGGGIGLSFIAIKLLPKYIEILAIIPIVVFSLALAFYKVNNRPFINLVESAITYFFRSHLYIWRRKEKKVEQSAADNIYRKLTLPDLTSDKLKNLSSSLDYEEKSEREEK